MKNLTDFTRSEGVPEEEIRRILQDLNQNELGKIDKGLRRWRMAGKAEGKLLIKAFDHWRMLIATRMMMKRLLNFSNNRVQWAKADM